MSKHALQFLTANNFISIALDTEKVALTDQELNIFINEPIDELLSIILVFDFLVKVEV